MFISYFNIFSDQTFGFDSPPRKPAKTRKSLNSDSLDDASRINPLVAPITRESSSERESPVLTTKSASKVKKSPKKKKETGKKKKTAEVKNDLEDFLGAPDSEHRVTGDYDELWLWICCERFGV